jgi:uncharacterized membrane protein
MSRSFGLVSIVLAASLQASSGYAMSHIAARPRALSVRSSLHRPSRVAPPCRALVIFSDVADVSEVAPPLLETTQRSIVKALSWRLTAAVVTLCTSLFFSGSMRAAISIVGADFATKAVTMFIGERLWNKSNVGRSNKGDSMGRSLLKALVWRVFAATNTLISAGLLSGAWDAAIKIAGSDTIIKTSLFFAFERMWALISWGRYPAPVEAEA